MSFNPGHVAKVMYGAVDLSGFFNSADHETTVDKGETTTFGKTAKVYIATLIDATCSLAGYWDGTAGAVDAVLAAALATNGNVATFGPAGLAIGSPVKLLDVMTTKYGVKEAVGGVVEASAELQSDAQPVSGVSLLDLASQASSNNGTSVDNGAGTGTGGIGHLHVVSGTGSLTAKVQHSTDNITFTDLLTFTAATGATSQRSSVAGTVNRYLRLLWTITTGPFVFTAGFART